MRRTWALFLVGVLMIGVGPAQADQTDPALDGLFDILQSTDDPDVAEQTEAQIWSVWIHHDVDVVEGAMAYGIQAMSAGAFQQSIATFNRIIKIAPDYAEAWNKRATVYYLVGRFDDSVRDIQKTLSLEPRHFGAMSGMGMIYDAIGQPGAAVNAWERALAIHPHMPGIRNRLKQIKRDLEGIKT